MNCTTNTTQWFGYKVVAAIGLPWREADGNAVRAVTIRIANIGIACQVGLTHLVITRSNITKGVVTVSIGAGGSWLNSCGSRVAVDWIATSIQQFEGDVI